MASEHEECKNGFCDHCEFPLTRCLCRPRCSQDGMKKVTTNGN